MVGHNTSVNQSLPVDQIPLVSQPQPVDQIPLVSQPQPVDQIPLVRQPQQVRENSLVGHNPSVNQSLPVDQNPLVSQPLQDGENPTLNNPSTISQHQATAQETIIPPNIRCVDITAHKQSVQELSTSQINKGELVAPDIVIRKFPSYQCISRVPTLAQRLASQSYFGDDVLGKCTVMGCRNSPALPLRELNNLKQNCFFSFRNSGQILSILRRHGLDVPSRLANAVKEWRDKYL